MATKKQQPKWTRAQVREHIRKIIEITQKYKRENKKAYFVAITPEVIEEKFKRVNSPMIVAHGWGDVVQGKVGYTCFIFNPDPTPINDLYVHVWVGSGLINQGLGTFLLDVDTRFSRLTEPHSGLTLPAGGGAVLDFELKVHGTVEKTNYLLNSSIIEFDPFQGGRTLDRGGVVFGFS